MYLKKIETQGFKSFANKTVLEFRPGIMGIVGPNGSGKSNVADAVRWVLGEQSAKQLRGSNMQDVIFAGTENRKPQGYAYVTLTIDNSDHMLAVDYAEVIVSRRVYRSGESEYRLNGSICRLRDILELFYDTGVGKEGYSIIGQGQIDRILSGRPEDRRELFDEAVGIVKFKKRKIMTLKKLETEEGNLVRVTDILKELERRVGPLEKEAGRAREYLKIHDELKNADVQAFRMEMGEFEKKTGEQRERLDIVQADADRTRAEAEKIRGEYDRLSEQIAALEEKLESARSLRSEAGIHRENLEGRLHLLEEKIRASVSDEAKVRERITALENQVTEKISEIGQLDIQMEEEEKNREALRLNRMAEEAKFGEFETEVSRLEKEIADLQEKKMGALAEKTGLSADMERAALLLEQSVQRKEELEARLNRTESESVDYDQQISELKAKKSRAAEAFDTYQREIRESAEAEKRIEEEQRLNSNAMLQTNQQYASVKAHRESLLRLTERYEGYNNSIRKIMELREDNPGVLGVVADLFHTEEKFETALEVALGGRIQNIVTDTEQTARDMIEYLKTNRQGRATFLPLSSVQARDGFPRPEACRERGAIGVAAELVSCEPRFRTIAGYLLGKTLIVDNMDHAIQIARKYRYTLNLVTLEGDYLSPGGAMTGGSRKNNNGSLLGRRREIDQLKGKQGELQRQLDGLRRDAQNLERQLTESRYLREQMQTKAHECELEQNTLSMEIQSREEQKANLSQGREGWKKEVAARIGDIARLTETKKNGEEKLAALEARISAWENRTDEDSLTVEGVRDDRERCRRDLDQYRKDEAAAEQTKIFREETRDRLENEQHALEEEQRALEEGLAGGDARRAENENEQEQIRRDMKTDEDTVQRLDQEIISCSAEKESVTEEQHRCLDRKDEMTDSLSLLDKDVIRLQNSLERLEEQESKLVSYLWDEYGMTPSEACREAEQSEEVSLTEARRRVSRARAALKELGPVNVNAIEEFKDVGERYTFMKAQHEDLVRGAEQLKGIIAELDESMRKQFREKFAQIQIEFEKVFRELFGGGKGRLELCQEDGKDILEAGILINAQPPGKKLQNMMQLSGGEKALSAIALLFAIQNLKPSPFCLLDEIEAALDEPNVDRYASYLNKLKDHTQFIVITHRRGTMETADCLYGITMQEKGVSTLVSVDLTDESLLAPTAG